MEIGEIIRTLLAAVQTLGPHVRKAALYVFVQREWGIEYEEKFTELLNFTREDITRMRQEVVEIRMLCQMLNMNTEAPGSAYWMNYKLDWYLTIRYRRVLDRLEHLRDEFASSISGIASVISCFAGFTADTPEGEQI